MRYSDSLIKYVMSLHWQKVPASNIAKLASEEYQRKLSRGDVDHIVATYTLRHHGDVVRRDEWVQS